MIINSYRFVQLTGYNRLQQLTDDSGVENWLQQQIICHRKNQQSMW